MVHCGLRAITFVCSWRAHAPAVRLRSVQRSVLGAPSSRRHHSFVVGAAALTWQSTCIQDGHAESGLVAAFNFDEGTGTTAADVSGLNNHGVITGATWSTTAKYGKACRSRPTALVTIADHPSLDLTTAFTLEAWVRPTSTSGWRTALLKEVPGELALRAVRNGISQGRRPGRASAAYRIRRSAVRSSSQMRGRISPPPMTTRRSACTSTAPASPRHR